MGVQARCATILDLTDIVVFGGAKHAQSNWSSVSFNASWFRTNVRAMLKDPDHCVLIARRDSALCGLLIGCRMPMLHSPLYCATDQVFVADAGGDQLLDLFLTWCVIHKVRRIDMGNSQAERPGMGRFMSRRGFSRGGGMYWRNQ